MMKATNNTTDILNTIWIHINLKFVLYFMHKGARLHVDNKHKGSSDFVNLINRRQQLWTVTEKQQ